jgi:hypothetical protein
MAAINVDDLLTSYPPPIVNTVERVRGLIHQVAPDVNEKANRGWRSISYRDPRVGYFCGIFPFEDHVDLIFEFGSLLDDPDGVLSGDAKQTRYIRFHEPKDIQDDTVKRFLKTALDLPPSHSTRRGLTQNQHISGSGEN